MQADDGHSPRSEPEHADDTVSLGYDPAATPPELARVLERYMAAIQAGEKPDRDRLLEEHPELADTLRECLSAIDFIHGASRKIDGPLGAGTGVQLGDFRIVREIGSGGMGVVYEAEQLSLRRRVALKVLRFGPASDPEAMQRFRREAETVAQLHHTNIVPVHAVGEEGGVHYFAMQFIDGESVAEAAARCTREEGALEPGVVVRWGLEAAEALAHAHARGVIHRDVKPSNLLLDRDGRVWLTDFGLARRLDDVTLSLSGMIMGTPRYMSPEQASAVGRPVDHRSDVYSLGATLYELLSGKPAFDADTPQAVIAQILDREPAALRRLRPELSRDLETVVIKCLAKEPSRRYQTADELGRDLRAVLDGRDIIARRPTLAERAARWLRRNQRVASAAGLAAVMSVLVVVAIIAGWRGVREARLGRISLETSGPSLAARVVDETDRLVVPEFSVPTFGPVAIPEGAYSLRLSAAGLPGETWPLDVERGVERTFDVGLRRRWLWPPMELRADEYPELEIVELDGLGADLVLSTRHAPPGDRGVRRVRRVDGASGATVWSFDLDASTLPPGGDLREWSSLLSHSGVLMGDRLLVHPAVDLSGDGVADPVWVARTTPSLLALSGADGSVLWWFRGRPSLPPDAETLAGSFKPRLPHGQVVGRPATADADGDGTVDFLACLATSRGDFVSDTGRTVPVDRQSWIEAVSGRTGRPIWRRALTPRFFAHAHDSETAKRGDRLGRPGIARVEGREVVVLASGDALLGLELASGEDAWPPRPLGHEPDAAPRIVDLDGDGESEALFHRFEGRAGSVVFAGRPSTLKLTLRALSLGADERLWEHAYQPIADDNAIERSNREWFLVEDLDGDGRTEVALPAGEFEAISNRGRARVELLDGVSGEVRWTSPLSTRPLGPLVPGPDLDGDGWRDLFVSWYDHDALERRTLLVVASLSSRDGRALWLWRRDISGRGRSASDVGAQLEWWHPGADGWPLLLVPTFGARSGQPMTFVLSSRRGELVDTIGDVASIDVADVSGDGIGDLIYRVAPQDAPRLLVVPGISPEPWRRLGPWRAAADFDGDGSTDLIGGGGSRLIARSGRDGRQLFAIPEKGFDPDEAFLAMPAPRGDLDGDGAPDLVFFDETAVPMARGIIRRPTVAAYSGRDGRQLWNAGDIGLSSASGSASSRYWGWRIPALEGADLDDDERAEILALQGGRDAGPGRWVLRALAGVDGRLIWQTPVLGGVIGLEPSPGPLWLADLDGDGWRDAVLWVPAGAGDGSRSDRDVPCELRAVSGRDGRLLWSAPDVAVSSSEDLLWRRVEGGDIDGDGQPEAVVALTDGWDRERRGYEPRIVVVNARSGEVRWQWRVESGSRDFLPSRLVDLDGAGRRSVCAGVVTRDGPRIVVLDARGELRDEIALELAGRDLQETAHVWRHGDVDGDGREELLFVSGGALRAARGGGDELWRWELPRASTGVRHYTGGAPRITEIIPGGEPRTPATVVVWSHTTVYGLDGATGRAVWRCEVPWGPATGMSSPPTLRRLETAGPDALPRFLCQWLQYGPDRDATAVRAAWPTGSRGSVRAPQSDRSGEPEEFEAFFLKRPLPWVGAGSLWRGPLFFPVLGFIIFLAAVVPGWLTLRATRGGAAALSVLAALWGAAWIAGLPRDPVGLIHVSTLILVAVPGQLAWRAWRGRSRRLGAFAAAATGILFAALLWRYAAGALFPRGPSPWHLVEFLVVPAWGLAWGLPSVTFCVLVVVWARQRRWRRLGIVLAGAAMLSAGAAWILVALDARAMGPFESYTWRGAHLIAFAGAWITGGIALAAFVVGRARARIARARPRGSET